MGVNRWTKCGCSSYPSPPDVNPAPKNFKILRIEEVGNLLILEVKYPNCTNFEGKKILVYQCKATDLLSQGELDPHFSNRAGYISPIARFMPTPEGWQDALAFAKVRG